jgi:hypothetical protein
LRPIVLPLACLCLLAGCGSEDRPRSTTLDRPDSERPAGRTDETIQEARCPDAEANCESATGRVLYVEAVDADGDGDAHFVLESGEGVTGPGISVIDVRRDLRPDPLPRSGDLVTASGPVYRGSYGQRQIQAEVVRVAP